VISARWYSKKGGEERIFILGHFYIILNLEEERKPASIPIANGPG
jgi:hypothetical protein